MNDRYLFRAKRKDWKQLPKEMWWVKGYLYGIWERRYILWGMINDVPNMVEVDTPTICQCTGLKDKNGKLIWENDVVRFKHEKFDFDDGLEPWERSCLPNKKEYTRNYAVEFCNTSTNYGLRFRNGSIWFMVHRMTVVMHDTEVIGNIFDNPELMHE